MPKSCEVRVAGSEVRMCGLRGARGRTRGGDCYHVFQWVRVDDSSRGAGLKSVPSV